MAEGYKDSEVTWVSWTKGSHCAARADDGKWYRARISNVIHKNVIEVRVNLSDVVRKPVLGFPTRSNTNQAVQLQNLAIGLKFWIKEVEGLCYQCSENKGADQLPNCRAADLRLCFCTYEKQVFS